MKPMTSTPALARARLLRSATARAVPILAVLAVLTGGYVAWRHFAGGTAPLTYTTTAVERGTVRQTVTASGTLSPVVRSTVGSQVSGRITEILVDFNDTVKRGQVLARLDPQVLQGQVSQAKARLASARADLARAQVAAGSAKLTFDRAKQMLAAGAIATSEVDAAKAAMQTATATVDASRAGIVEAQAQLENAQSNLGYTTITAPIDGVIISRSVDAGQTVAASLQAPELFVIAGDLAKMELHASVAEADVGQLADGMDVELAFDAFPDRTFGGKVRQVRNQATTTSNVVTYAAVVSVDNPDGVLRPGMTATATFVVAASPPSLVVPQKALRYRPANAKAPERPRAPSENAARADAKVDAPAADRPAAADRPRRDRSRGAVWVLRANQPVRVPVTIGLSDGTSVAVTSDALQEGDLVITADSTAKSGSTPTAGPRGGNPRGGGRSGPQPIL